MGEHVKASVVLTPESKLTAEELKAFCKANMPSFRVPKEIEFLSSLPKNPSGKVLISELKKRRLSPVLLICQPFTLGLCAQGQTACFVHIIQNCPRTGL